MTDGNDPISFTSEGTVNFLPNRLNRQPIVVLGLTANELFFVGLSSAIAGVVIGIPFAFVFSAFAMVPTVVLFAVFLGIGLTAELRRAYQDVADAKGLKVQKVPAVIVDRTYVVYGLADVAEATGLIDAYLQGEH